MSDIVINLIHLPKGYRLDGIYRDKYVSVSVGETNEPKVYIAQATLTGFGIHVIGGPWFKSKLKKMIDENASELKIRNYVLEKLVKYLAKDRGALLYKLLEKSKQYGRDAGKEEVKADLAEKFSDLMKEHLFSSDV